MNENMDSKLTQKDLELIKELIKKLDPNNEFFNQTNDIIKIRKKMLFNSDKEFDNKKVSVDDQK